MASNLKLPSPFRQARADTWATRAGDASLLRLYSGTQPATADDAITGTLLAELVCGTPFAPAASAAGVVTANPITQDSGANATGTATHFRWVRADGATVVADGSVGTTDADLNLVSVAIAAGQPVQISSWTITELGA